jgi:hypothetical protein
MICQIRAGNILTNGAGIDDIFTTNGDPHPSSAPGVDAANITSRHVACYWSPHGYKPVICLHRLSLSCLMIILLNLLEWIPTFVAEVGCIRNFKFSPKLLSPTSKAWCMGRSNRLVLIDGSKLESVEHRIAQLFQLYYPCVQCARQSHDHSAKRGGV